ncbi:ABC transporter permease [Agromyces fucosus]|uniref:ABC transporter permease n=1 Tax=Agromyces fucosus TaxID=41985 RepID=A0A4Q2JK73_9MICO|nr:ABC transporter permease [Agromyces fucosus]RXZ46430.1 ABC transporter permease [Agromyces fucosus]
MTSRSNRLTSVLSDNRVGLLLLIIVLVVLIGSLKPMFFSPAFVIGPMLTSIAIFTVVGLAQMVVLSVGQMNLAVGGMAAIGAMGSAIVFQAFDVPLIVGIAVGLVVGGAVGALCGVLIAYAGVNSFVVTLAMSFALLGLVPAVYSWVSTGNAITVQTPGLAELGRSKLSDLCIGDTCGPDGVPLILFVAVAAMIVIGLLFSKARIGREILLTGSSDRAALLSAIPVPRRIITVHTLSGMLAALAGFMLGASTGSFTPGIGQEFMLQSFLGPILGGTLLAGGYVSVIGTFLGITITVVIRQGLLLFGVGIEGLNILLGTILLIALSADRIRSVAGARSRLRASRQQSPAKSKEEAVVS